MDFTIVCICNSRAIIKFQYTFIGKPFNLSAVKIHATYWLSIVIWTRLQITMWWFYQMIASGWIGHDHGYWKISIQIINKTFLFLT